MLLLTSASDLVRVVTDATADIEVHASWLDLLAGAVTPGRTNTASITTATTTTVVGSPGGSAQRNVRHLNARNNHGSTACNVTVEHTDGTTVETLMKCTLLAGEVLTLDQEGRWVHFTANGMPYTKALVVATQTDMETGTSTELATTPLFQHFHPGHPKARCKCGITANILASYNIASITDSGVGLVTVVMLGYFSSADWVCEVTVERAATALTVADLRTAAIRSGQQGVGLVLLECHDRTAITALLADPTAWHMSALGDFRNT